MHVMYLMSSGQEAEAPECVNFTGNCCEVSGLHAWNCAKHACKCSQQRRFFELLHNLAALARMQT